MRRQRWSSKKAFILAALGSAVGLGNIWRFPYLAGKYGGGSFLIPYLIALIFIGIPLLVLEFAVGQFIQKGVYRSFQKIHSGFKGLGLFVLVSAFIIASYYAVIMAWTLLYLFSSFKVSWSDNTSEFFYNDILQLSDTISVLSGINWTVILSLLFVWISIYFCVWKGTKSIERVIRYSVPLPVILLGLMLVRVITLPGYFQGWQLYLQPVWSTLIEPDVWNAAFSQIFYTLSLAFGIMITYSSYKDPEDEIVKDACITAYLNSGISLFCGFIVFGVLGFMALQTDIPLTELATSGPGLAFVVFPQALSLMPFPWIFSAIFFLMLFSLGIDSAFSIVEILNGAIIDDRNTYKTSYLTIYICIVLFLSGIIFTTKSGLYFLDIIDHYVTNYDLIIIATFQSLLVGWVYGAEKIRITINKYSAWKVGKWWNFSIQYFIPISLISMMSIQLSRDIKHPYGDYPVWANGIGWLIVIIPVSLFIYYFLKDLAQRYYSSARQS